MAVKVGINGFGRIGRNVLRASLNDPAIEYVAVNDITDPKTLAHLLKYDSVLGVLDAKVGHGQDCVTVNGRPIRVFKVRTRRTSTGHRRRPKLCWTRQGCLLPPRRR